MAESFKNAGLVVTTSQQALYTCPASTTSVVHALYISNVDGGTSAKVSVTVYDNSGAIEFHVGLNLPVPVEGTLVLDKPINLEENDELRLVADANGDIEAIASVLEIT